MNPLDSEKSELIQKFKTDIDEYFYYSSLISKKRLPSIQEEINKIARKATSIISKIREIEKIDSNNATDEKQNENQKGGEQGVVSVFDDTFYYDIKKRVRIKQPGFFTFVFSWRKRLKMFSKKILTIIPKFFGLKYKFSPVFFYVINAILERIKKYAYAPVKAIVDNGWRYLNRHEYNLVYTFFKFMHEFLMLSSLKVDNGIKSNAIIGYFKNIVPPFLQLIMHTNNRLVLENAIDNALSEDVKYKGAIYKIRELIDFLYNKKVENRNFVQSIVSVFSLHYKQIVTLPMIYSHYSVKEINKDTFVCDRAIAFKISNRISEIDNRLEQIEKKLYIMRYLDMNVSISRIDNADLKYILKDVISFSVDYEKESKKPYYFLEYFASDMMKTAALISSGFIDMYEDVMVGDFNAKFENRTGKLRVFQPDVFAPLFKRLRNLYVTSAEYIEKKPYIYITQKQYEKYCQTGFAENKKMRTGFVILEGMRECFYNIAETLSRYLHNHVLAGRKFIKQANQDSLITNDPLSLVEKPPRFIPYFDAAILEPQIKNKRVVEILDHVLLTSSNLSYILGSRSLSFLIREKRDLIAESEKLLEEKSRYF